jgi:hypothetical protein
MERLIEAEYFDAVLDVTTTELVNFGPRDTVRDVLALGPPSEESGLPCNA